jgi:hypothetical protein
VTGRLVGSLNHDVDVGRADRHAALSTKGGGA